MQRQLQTLWLCDAFKTLFRLFESPYLSGIQWHEFKAGLSRQTKGVVQETCKETVIILHYIKLMKHKAYFNVTRTSDPFVSKKKLNK